MYCTVEYLHLEAFPPRRAISHRRCSLCPRLQHGGDEGVSGCGCRPRGPPPSPTSKAACRLSHHTCARALIGRRIQAEQRGFSRRSARTRAHAGQAARQPGDPQEKRPHTQRPQWSGASCCLPQRRNERTNDLSVSELISRLEPIAQNPSGLWDSLEELLTRAPPSSS